MSLNLWAKDLVFMEKWMLRKKNPVCKNITSAVWQITRKKSKRSARGHPAGNVIARAGFAPKLDFRNMPGSAILP